MLIELYVDWTMMIFYVAGTAFGLWLGYSNKKETAEEAVERTIDMLIDNNLVRWKKDPDTGEVELIPLDDKNN